MAPANDPKIALAVIVENAGWGAGSAAPIARRVFDYMLMGQYPNDEDMAAVQKGQAAAPIGKPRSLADMTALLPGGNGPMRQEVLGTPTLVSTSESAASAQTASKPVLSVSAAGSRQHRGTLTKQP